MALVIVAQALVLKFYLCFCYFYPLRYWLFLLFFFSFCGGFYGGAGGTSAVLHTDMWSGRIFVYNT